MAEHSVSVTVNAPVHQVYELYTHFNDYPKFMTFVREVTYLDGERSHWVVDVAGRHEWDAINDGWIADRQIGWRSLDGLSNSGRVRFEPVGTGATKRHHRGALRAAGGRARRARRASRRGRPTGAPHAA